MDPYNPYHLFAQTLRKYWSAYALGAGALLLTSFSEVMLPKFIQWAIDTTTLQDAHPSLPSFLRQTDKHSSLNLIVAALILTLMTGWLGRFAWRQILSRLTHVTGHRVKTRIWNVLKDQPLTLTDRFSLGDLMNRATGDWNKTRFIHGFTMVITFDLIFFLSLSTVAMMMIDPITAVLCLLVFPFLPKPIIRISKREYTLHEYAQEQLSLLSDLISQSVNTIRMQRSTASEHIWLLRLRVYAEEYAKRQFLVLKASWRIFLLAALPSIFGYLILFTYGIYKVNQGELSVGAFIALQSYILLLQSPLSELGNNISEWQTGFASYKRITEIYRLETELKFQKQDHPSSNRAQAPALEIDQLQFRYNAQRDVLKDISLKVRHGEKIGFIGPIGSGKTTLIHIIAGLQEFEHGSIKVFGQDLQLCQRSWITEHIAMVPQKPFLFAGTIAHNLSPSDSKSKEELIQILSLVELWEDVQRLPRGLDSWIGEWGINLSGGQKQRLSLARALLKSSDIYIFDDCLSAVDSLTELQILNNLKSYLEGKTVLWTAHRRSTLQICDRIFQLENSRLTLTRWDDPTFQSSKDDSADQNAFHPQNQDGKAPDLSILGEIS